MKQTKLFKAALVIAALLLFQSAAIDATAAAQSKKATRKKAAPAAAVKETSAQAPDAPPVSSPAKANSREATPAPTTPPAKTETEGATTTLKAEMPAASVRYSYEFNQPNFVVRRVLIEHDAAGRGNISFARKDSEEVFTDPLEITPAALARITAEWEALKFLDSETNYQAEKQFPHLGAMTLHMKQGTRKRRAEFNWTHDEHAAALVKEYKSIGEQQLFIFDVTIARQYQPSDTIKIFKRLEILIERKEVFDPTQLVPLLRDLMTDERIPLIARNHATRLLKKIEK